MECFSHTTQKEIWCYTDIPTEIPLFVYNDGVADSTFYIESEGRGIPRCLNAINTYGAQCWGPKQLCGLSCASLVPIKWFFSKPRLVACTKTSRRKQQYARCLSMPQLLPTKSAQKTALFHTLGSTLELEEEKRTQRYLE